MRTLSSSEVMTLSTLLKMENDALLVAKPMKGLISDQDLKKQAEAGELAAESRIKGLQQFIKENDVTSMEVQ
jgi:hypothetical protein